jgi:hypothetical protein
MSFSMEKAIQANCIPSQGGRYHLQANLLDKVSFPLVQEDVSAHNAARTNVILIPSGF